MDAKTLEELQGKAEGALADLESFKQDSDVRFAALHEQYLAAERTFNTTIGVIREQRDAANDQVVQHRVRNIQLEEYIKSLREMIDRLNEQIGEKDIEITKLKDDVNTLTADNIRLRSPQRPLEVNHTS
jgi:chromosome segregation ATPase